MPDDYISAEGNTVDEAVNKALKALRITREQADIKVLSEGKQGFLGLGSQPAKVQVCLKQEAAVDLELSDILAELDIQDEAREEKYRPKIVNKDYGTAEVKDGRLIITNPIAEGKYATVKPGKHVNLTVNGKKVNDEVFLSENDEISIELDPDEPVNCFELSLSEDKVQAYVRLVSRPGAKYQLKNQPSSNKLILLTEVEEIVEPLRLQEEDLKKFLQENKVVKGIFDDAFEQVLQNPNSKDAFLIAQGQRPADGKDAYVKFPFLGEGQEDSEEGGLFGRTRLLSVNQGDIIAIKVPMEEGIDGWTVEGECINARIPVDCQIVVKQGCDLVEESCKVVASIAGRPVHEIGAGSVTVAVEPVFEVKDVDSTTGDIKFSGDVIVKGDVKEGFKVEAKGSIEVSGDVTRATLQAGASVKVHKMIIGSTIVAGGLGALYSSILPLLKDIKDLLESTYNVASQLKGASGFKTSDLQAQGDGQLIQLLMDSKFHGLPKAVTDLSVKVLNSEQSVHDELLNVVNILNKSLCGLGPLHLEKVDYLLILRKAVDQVINLVSGQMLSVNCITARYVQNSTLQSSGDVIIEGQGVYISTVTAGGEVIVSGTPGIARGVKIIANKNITVKELGSEFDTQTSVTLKGNGKISAELIHPNVILQIGTERFRIDKGYKNLDAYVNHEGRLIIDKLLAEAKN